MAIDRNTSAQIGFIERSNVPSQFPQFKNAAALAHLAHTARGPKYVLVGGKAWYDPEDIRVWLEQNKRTGPLREPRSVVPTRSNPLALHGPKKRGRPTKLEQMKRRTGAAA